MPVSIKTASPALAIVAAATSVAPPSPTPTKRVSPPVNLTLPGRLRAAEVIALLKISESWFWKGVGTGLYPKPDYYVGKIPFWKHSTVLKVIEHGESQINGEVSQVGSA